MTMLIGYSDATSPPVSPIGWRSVDNYQLSLAETCVSHLDYRREARGGFDIPPIYDRYSLTVTARAFLFDN